MAFSGLEEHEVRLRCENTSNALTNLHADRTRRRRTWRARLGRLLNRPPVVAQTLEVSLAAATEAEERAAAKYRTELLNHSQVECEGRRRRRGRESVRGEGGGGMFGSLEDASCSCVSAIDWG
eukprot:3625988-Pleurochrysis_carterae.AAC.2